MVVLAFAPDLSHELVRQVLDKNQLPPHPRRMWRIPPDPSAAFVVALEDVRDVFSCRLVDPRGMLVYRDAISAGVTFARVVRDLIDGPYRDAGRIVPVMDQRDTRGRALRHEAFRTQGTRRLIERPETRRCPSPAAGAPRSGLI